MTPEQAGKLLDALNIVREALPVVGLLIDAVDPALIPFEHTASQVLGKIFEAGVVYLQHQTPEAAQDALRKSVAAGWGARIGGTVEPGKPA